MKLTRERKVLLAVLALGALALLVDRLFLASGHTGPQHAAAEVEVEAEPRAATARAEATQSAPSSSGPDDADQIMQATMALLRERDDGPLLNERLSETAKSHGVSPLNPRNAFEPPKAWIASGETNAEPDDPAPSSLQQAPTPAEQAQRFREQHRLRATMTERGTGVAIIGLRALRLGDELDGFTLERIGERSAVFSSETVRVELKVAER